MSSTQTLSTQIQDIISLLDTASTNATNQTNQSQSIEIESKTTEEDSTSGGGYDGKIKCPKGTRDYGPGDMIIREEMMDKIKSNFRKFGGQFMETPVFELRDILMDKYGEDEKLIYDLARQEAEPLCLRYDLTVPLARYVAINRRNNIKSPFKAARVGRVYRRDQPYMSKGRLREFWQCDFDIVRTAEPTNALDLVFDDLEVVALTIQQLIDLLGDTHFVLLINNRKLLDAVLDICKVPNDKIRAISAAIDKLDKKEWQCVKQEMLDKGISGETAELIRRFTAINGNPEEVLNKLKNDEYLKKHQSTSSNSKEAIEEFELLLTFLKEYNADYMKYLRIDMSMVRGLDYYTGIIMEAQFADTEVASQYGSIAGGGRYDKLVSRFVSSEVEQYPCCGSSLGFERIFSYLKNTHGVNVGVSTDVLICELAGKNGTKLGLYEERLKLLNLLRQNTRMNVEIINKISPSFRDQINYAEQREIKWMIIIGDDEIKNNTINLRRLTLEGDIIVTADGKRGQIKEIVTDEKSKWPKFKVKPIGNQKKGKKEWILTKKQIKKVIENDEECELQIKGLPRVELIAFFDKIYNVSST